MTDAGFVLDVYAVDGRRVWPYFAPHHYMTDEYRGHRAFVAAMTDGAPVGFASIIAQPSGSFRNGWRGHRTVVLPDFQGLGIGARLSDWVGEYVVTVMGGRYFSRTVHPRLGEYREQSPLWRPTSHNRRGHGGAVDKGRNAATGAPRASIGRTSYAHEYIRREDDHAGG